MLLEAFLSKITDKLEITLKQECISWLLHKSPDNRGEIGTKTPLTSFGCFFPHHGTTSDNRQDSDCLSIAMHLSGSLFCTEGSLFSVCLVTFLRICINYNARSDL